MTGNERAVVQKWALTSAWWAGGVGFWVGCQRLWEITLKVKRQLGNYHYSQKASHPLLGSL